MIITLIEGVPLEVSAWFGKDHVTVRSISDPQLSDGSHFRARKEDASPESKQFYDRSVRFDDQFKKRITLDGVATTYVEPGKHMIFLSVPYLVFSDYVEFTAELGKPLKLDLEIKPGAVVKGYIDSKVPRPIQDGHVKISVCPPLKERDCRASPTEHRIKEYTQITHLFSQMFPMA